MITVTFHKTKAGEYQDFICSGHAGFNDYGKDIVCAAVSVLVINTVNSLDELVRENIEVETDEENGIISCRFQAPLRDTSKVLVDSLALGLSHITKQYGEKYCKLNFEEV
ncbi:MAG: ribosomal-processing cysteine protease Prp [Bacillus sp. (in: Bacteria)]|nr:ribosomal-processing cysteine protease Prp [Bacillus sp. (in: firmicutes)]MCM1425895.1 ribosomal-processing cysteine protease Prp [Eubacterium sp.]